MRNLHRGPTGAAQVRALLQDGPTGGLGDGELLERYASGEGDRAESAFAAIVERHGPMVLRACRAILGDPHRAQDAFQATFLLLSRRAGSLWVRDSIAPWLHSVACRTASGARAAEVRRRAMERRAAGRTRRSVDDPDRDDLGAALHEEIDRLPDRLKAPVVLCYLEGLTHDQAADHLACPVGTVRSRMARGRDRLRRGLARRGYAPPASAVESPRGSVPASLATLTIQAARLAADRSTIGLVARWSVFFSEGVLRPMMIHPLKSAAVLLLASGVVAVGLGATSGQDPKPPAAAEPPRDRDRTADDLRFEAIERRLRELELKLEGVATPRRPIARTQGIDPSRVINIRPRFNNALVEKVYVGQGEVIKKGEPLLLIRSAELGVAKNELRTRFVQWDHDRKFLIAREPLAKSGRITQLVWTDTQNDEKKSRLDYLVSREKLATYGMTNEQIDKLLEGLTDDPKKAPEVEDNIEDITRMVVTAPIGGVVVERNVLEGNFYDQSEVLLVIAPPSKVVAPPKP